MAEPIEISRQAAIWGREQVPARTWGHARQARPTVKSARNQTRIPVTIVEQGNGAVPQAAPDLIKDTTTQTFVKDVIEES